MPKEVAVIDRYRAIARSVLLTLIGSVLLAGCATIARERDGAVFGADFAEANFKLGLEDTVGFGTATTQEYLIGSSDDRQEAARVTMFTWVNKADEKFLLPANERVFVFAEMTGLWGAPGLTSSGEDTCLNISSFTPVGGVRYTVLQRGEPTLGCLLSIVETDSGREPADLERVMFSAKAEK